MKELTREIIKNTVTNATKDNTYATKIFSEEYEKLTEEQKNNPIALNILASSTAIAISENILIDVLCDLFLNENE